MLIDTHAHLNFRVYENNWREVADEAVAGGVEKMIIVGADIKTSRRAVELAEQHPALYAAVGIHPHHSRALLGSSNIKTQMSKLIHELREMARKPRVVAIGEVGLDRHLYEKSKYQTTNDNTEADGLDEIQKQLFQKQIELAMELDKPLIIHSREVGEEVLRLMSNVKEQMSIKKTSPPDSPLIRGRNSSRTTDSPVLRGVFHCFEGGKKMARKVVEAGFYIGFTGNITYAFDRTEVAKTIPLERLLLETDCPYMLPEPLRSGRIKGGENNNCLIGRGNAGGLVNKPINVKIIASHHASSRGIDPEIVMEQTATNARQLFRF